MMKQQNGLTPLERSWVLYDIGNSAFILLIATLIPIFFNGLASEAGIPDSTYLSYWGYAGSVSTVLVAFIDPICGTLADRKGYKKPIFLLCVLAGALGCIAMGLATDWLTFLVIFILAKVGYNASLVFYDAMLPEITTPERMDNVSSAGYAWGYIGSVIPFIGCLLLVLFGERFGIPVGKAMVLSLLITAIWWLALTVPLLRRYRQTAFVEPTAHPVRDTFVQLGKTLKGVRQERHIFLYMLAFFLYIDGVYTVIDMAAAYGAALNLPTEGLLLALLLTQFVAFPFAILFGVLSKKYDTGLLIKICIAAYTGITLFAVFLRAQWQFWLLAVLVGMFQGGVQALSRSYLGKIIPAEQSGEYYGLMDICGKGASFMGTTLVAAVNQLCVGWTFSLGNFTFTGENIAIGTLVIFFALGYYYFCKADKLNKERSLA